MTGQKAYKRSADFYRQVGRNIRTARTTLGRSQAELADHVKVSYQQFQKYELGQNRIPLKEFAKVAAYLEVPFSNLLGEDDLSPSDSPLHELIEEVPGEKFQALLKSWVRIKDPRMKAAIVDFVKALAALNR